MGSVGYRRSRVWFWLGAWYWIWIPRAHVPSRGRMVELNLTFWAPLGTPPVRSHMAAVAVGVKLVGSIGAFDLENPTNSGKVSCFLRSYMTLEIVISRERSVRVWERVRLIGQMRKRVMDPALFSIYNHVNRARLAQATPRESLVLTGLGQQNPPLDLHCWNCHQRVR